MLVITWTSSVDSISSIGIWHFLGIAGVAFFFMNRVKIHPAFLIIAAFA
jgi:chromate transporter